MARAKDDRSGSSKDAPTRREQILQVSADLFARHGYQSVSIYDIGAAMGVSGAALYRYFPSKDAILVEIIVTECERLVELGAQVVAATDGNPLEALVKAHADSALTHQAVIRVFLRDFDSIPEPDRERVKQLQRRYVDLWVDAFCDRWPAVPRAQARSTTLAVFGLTNSTPYSADSSLPVDQASALIQALALAAFEAAAESVAPAA